MAGFDRHERRRRGSAASPAGGPGPAAEAQRRWLPRPPLSGWRRAELREELRRRWRPRAARDGVRVEVVTGRRSSDVAFVWLRGDRSAVLSLLSKVALHEPWSLDLGSGAWHSGRYELSAWVGVAARGGGLLPDPAREGRD